MPGNREVINPVHEDEYAKQFGLRGALIGGTTLLALVMEMLFLYFGKDWLYHGKIKTSFIGGGAIDGDELTAHGKITRINSVQEGTLVELEVWLENQNREKIVVGQASCTT
jgi:hypothetical protein